MIKKLLIIRINPNRIYGLDILRALAILFVVFEHGSYLLPDPLREFHHIFIFDGVSIFFVLSGFLIGSILIKITQNKQIGLNTLLEFWKRRWFRTLPNYFLILSIIFTYFIIKQDKFQINDHLGFLFFTQNLYYKHPPLFPEAWSLSVEEWFYIISPIILFILIIVFKLKQKSALLITALLILFAATFFRLYRYGNVNIESFRDWDLIFRKQVITRLDCIMYGVIGAFVKFYYPQIWNKNKLAKLITGILIFILSKFLILTRAVDIGGIYNSIFSFSFISLATLLLLPYLNSIKSGSGFIYKRITQLSLLSYSMYLLNLSIVQLIIIKSIIPWVWMDNFIFLKSPLQYITFWGLTIIGSIILYKFYELPMTNLRDKKWTFRKHGKLL